MPGAFGALVLVVNRETRKPGLLCPMCGLFFPPTRPHEWQGLPTLDAGAVPTVRLPTLFEVPTDLGLKRLRSAEWVDPLAEYIHGPRIVMADRGVAARAIAGLLSFELSEEQFFEAYPKDSTDVAVFQIGDLIITDLWLDLQTWPKHLEDDAYRELFDRCGAFLRTGYDWPWPTKPGLFVASLRGLLHVLTLRLFARTLVPWVSMDPIASWPFEHEKHIPRAAT